MLLAPYLSFAAYPSGLVSYWPFDSNANDAMGLNNGVVNGATLQATGGQVGGAYHFNNASYIDLGTSINTYGENYSMIYWAKGSGSIISNEYGCVTYPQFYSYFTNDSVRFMQLWANANNYSDVTVPLYTANWSNIVVTYNGTHIAIYVNGALVMTNASTGTWNSTENTYVGAVRSTGACGSPANRYFTGFIDEIAYFNRSLSASEASQFYNNSKDGLKNYFGDCRHDCVSFGAGTQNDSATLAARSVFANITLNTATTLTNFTFNWNGTNYSIYDPSLVGMWNFDGSLADSSAYGNNGTSVNTSFAAGKYGNGIYCNGNSQYVSVPNSQSLNITGPMTLSVWINRAGISSQSSGVIIHKESGGAAINGGYYLGDDNLTYSNISWRIRDSNNNFTVLTTTSPISNNQWHHIAVVFNGTALFLYVDGVLNNSIPSSITSIGGTTTLLGIGAPQSSPTWGFNGSIDEVRIFNRSLSAAEVKQLYLSNLKKINSTSWEFDTNQTNLTDGAYTYAGYATDTQGYTDTTGLRSVTLAYNPVVSTYGGSTTNFATVPDMTNVTNLTLEKVGKGKIKFPSSHSVNAAGQDYDSNVVMGNGFISVNSTGLDSSFNSTATL
ncbi:MAG TPA: LamG domain-containing protein, partial [Candidatus Micrarchaeota archaeon]|nr:LamG domain-containing protein [Candidatus Micrarchaeota archaeon]